MGRDGYSNWPGSHGNGLKCLNSDIYAEDCAGRISWRMYVIETQKKMGPLGKPSDGTDLEKRSSN